jgi:hypothetical protein
MMTNKAEFSKKSPGPLRMALRPTIEIYKSVLQSALAPLLVLEFVEFASAQFFSYATNYVRQMGREDVALIACIAVLEMLVTMIWSAAWLIAVAKIAEGIWQKRVLLPTFKSSMIQHFNQTLIEQVRALAAVIWRIPLLIIPALNEYIRLYFVPLIVILHPDYDKGAVDALEESRRLSRGHFWGLNTLITLIFLGPWLAQSLAQADGSEFIWENPLGVSIGYIVTFFINVFTTIYLCSYFREIMKRQPVQENT